MIVFAREVTQDIDLGAYIESHTPRMCANTRALGFIGWYKRQLFDRCVSSLDPSFKDGDDSIPCIVGHNNFQLTPAMEAIDLESPPTKSATKLKQRNASSSSQPVFVKERPIFEPPIFCYTFYQEYLLERMKMQRQGRTLGGKETCQNNILRS